MMMSGMAERTARRLVMRWSSAGEWNLVLRLLPVRQVRSAYSTVTDLAGETMRPVLSFGTEGRVLLSQCYRTFFTSDWSMRGFSLSLKTDEATLVEPTVESIVESTRHSI